MVGWGGCECDDLVSNTLSLSVSATSTHPTMVSHSPVYQSRCVLANLTSFFLVLTCAARCGQCARAFRKWNGFGDDVIAEQPSHPCLVVYHAVCHVTPCVFLSSEPWLKQCSSL